MFFSLLFSCVVFFVKTGRVVLFIWDSKEAIASRQSYVRRIWTCADNGSLSQLPLCRYMYNNGL